VNSDESAEVIRQRMAQLRRDLTCDVQDVSRSVGGIKRTAREMANPLYFIRRFPWASAGIAVAIGYLLVPKKKQVVTPDPEMLAELVRKEQVKVETSKAGTDTQGMLKGLVVMGLTWALRTGLTYAGQRLAAAAMQKPPQDGPPHHGEDHPPAPSPLEEPWNTTR
jgi:hypothetical protein